jgi:hypothetical protein
MRWLIANVACSQEQSVSSFFIQARGLVGHASVPSQSD